MRFSELVEQDPNATVPMGTQGTSQSQNSSEDPAKLSAELTQTKMQRRQDMQNRIKELQQQKQDLDKQKMELDNQIRELGQAASQIK